MDITVLNSLINSLLQQLAKRDNIVVECNHVSSHETSDKMHCSVLSNHKEVKQNTTHEDNMNAATENRNLTTKTGNGNKHQQNRKKIRNKKKIKNQTKNRKKESHLPY